MPRCRTSTTTSRWRIISLRDVADDGVLSAAGIATVQQLSWPSHETLADPLTSTRAADPAGSTSYATKQSVRRSRLFAQGGFKSTKLLTSALHQLGSQSAIYSSVRECALAVEIRSDAL
jgi:hypothetical protein